MVYFGQSTRREGDGNMSDGERSEAEFTPDPGAAIQSLGPAVSLPPADKPRRGRPPGAAPSMSPGAVYQRSHRAKGGTKRDRSNDRPRDNDPRTREQLLQEISAQKARLDMASVSGADLQAAKDCIKGIITAANMAAEFANAKELSFTTPEQNGMADLWAPPAAPYLAKLGGAQPWIAAVLGTLFIVWPKWVAYVDRRTAETTDSSAPAAPNAPPGPLVEVHLVP